ncbi:DUF4157 domain-containing protein [Phormidium sp. CLA17]|uniref:eCIS core domain-containing protein n=1 Tax=Leptolyngbya sp. Cla-17 TaxID=2803751 RepID=UPI0019325352|nr:DUF4157 domain-containing protein [Leptolyngbya sp. Cla-17]MBM0744567.1 DUF4157 domain-containing protein [Leptolyngbya sp. Cla-17]
MKLTVGAPGDQYEQEADRVAAQVVQRLNAPPPNPPSPARSQSDPSVQRETLPNEEDLQMQPMADQIQRVDMPEEEEVQMKPMVQRQAGEEAATASTNLESSIQQARSGGQPLADTIRQPMEQAFGADFSGVKVHTDAQSDQLNRSIQAKAFTTGQDIFFRQGAYQPENRGGQELIAHELTHVMQQEKEQRIQRIKNVKSGEEEKINWDTLSAEAAESYLQRIEKGELTAEESEKLRLVSIKRAQASDAIFELPQEDAPDPIKKIKFAILDKTYALSIGNSRPKIVYLFDDLGEKTKRKQDAKYMIDTEMGELEFSNLKQVESRGLKIPRIYGLYQLKYPIIQWLSDQSTIGGAGAKPLVPMVKQIMKLDNLQKKAFAKDRWQRTLEDVEQLIALNFTSPDLQFMIDNSTGHIYMMDLEASNTPHFGEDPDKRLTDLKEFLEKAIEIGGIPDSPEFSSLSTGMDKGSPFGISSEFMISKPPVRKGGKSSSLNPFKPKGLLRKKI